MLRTFLLPVDFLVLFSNCMIQKPIFSPIDHPLLFLMKAVVLSSLRVHTARVTVRIRFDFTHASLVFTLMLLQL